LYAFTTRPSHSTLLSTEGDESDGTWKPVESGNIKQSTKQLHGQ